MYSNSKKQGDNRKMLAKQKLNKAIEAYAESIITEHDQKLITDLQNNFSDIQKTIKMLALELQKLTRKIQENQIRQDNPIEKIIKKNEKQEEQKKQIEQTKHEEQKQEKYKPPIQFKTFNGNLYLLKKDPPVSHHMRANSSYTVQTINRKFNFPFTDYTMEKVLKALKIPFKKVGKAKYYEAENLFHKVQRFIIELEYVIERNLYIHPDLNGHIKNINLKAMFEEYKFNNAQKTLQAA